MLTLVSHNVKKNNFFAHNSDILSHIYDFQKEYFCRQALFLNLNFWHK